MSPAEDGVRQRFGLGEGLLVLMEAQWLPIGHWSVRCVRGSCKLQRRDHIHQSEENAQIELSHTFFVVYTHLFNHAMKCISHHLPFPST
jgi:hypothetical protein